MLIEELKLKSFKGFSDFTLKCSPLTTLVGLNNSGKTSVLHAIQLAFDVFRYAFGGFQGPEPLEPNLSNPQWAHNPDSSVGRLGVADPDYLWFNKLTSIGPCEVRVKLSGEVEIQLKVIRRGKYELDLLVYGNTVKPSLEEPHVQKVITDLYTWHPQYTPPVGGISPVEDFLHYPQLMTKLNRGLLSECWRSYLWWLWNDGDKALYNDVVEMTKEYLPDVHIREPRLTHDQPERILIEFDQEGVDFDLSASGGGSRTIFGLAVILYFSKTPCLLLDEPDAHLHASLQRKVAQMLLDHALQTDRQVFVTSHAPDFIAEIPIEYIQWIDRDIKQSKSCNDLGRFLTDLGSITKADATRAYGADKILFVEGGLDRKILAHFISLFCEKTHDSTDPFNDPKTIVAQLPNGKGDAEHLVRFRELLRAALKVNCRLAAIVDSDYEHPVPDLVVQVDDVAVLTLPRKEIENYLIDPRLIAAVLKVKAERKQRAGFPAQYPTPEQVESGLKQILDDPQLYDLVRCQLVPKYRANLRSKLDSATKEQEAENWFRNNWAEVSWQIDRCPGKHVLSRLRDWCSQNYSLSLTSRDLIKELKKIPADLQKIGTALQECLYSDTDI